MQIVIVLYSCMCLALHPQQMTRSYSLASGVRIYLRWGLGVQGLLASAPLCTECNLCSRPATCNEGMIAYIKQTCTAQQLSQACILHHLAYGADCSLQRLGASPLRMQSRVVRHMYTQTPNTLN